MKIPPTETYHKFVVIIAILEQNPLQMQQACIAQSYCQLAPLWQHLKILKVQLNVMGGRYVGVQDAAAEILNDFRNLLARLLRIEGTQQVQ